VELKSMKMDAAEAKAATELSVSDRPEYPWGLRLNLSNEALEKLGFKNLPEVGTKMTLVANVEVCSVSAHESKGGDKHRSMDLQITDMGLAVDEGKPDPATKLYGA
jgi:hypothetical protein